MESLTALGRLRRTNCVVENCVVGLWEFELAQEGRAVSATASNVVSPERLRDSFRIETAGLGQKLEEPLRKLSERNAVRTLLAFEQPVAECQETCEG